MGVAVLVAVAVGVEVGVGVAVLVAFAVGFELGVELEPHAARQKERKAGSNSTVYAASLMPLLAGVLSNDLSMMSSFRSDKDYPVALEKLEAFQRRAGFVPEVLEMRFAEKSNPEACKTTRNRLLVSSSFNCDGQKLHNERPNP